MMTDKEIEKLATEVAKELLGPREVESVSSEPTIDSSGEEAIWLTIVIAEGALDRVSDDAVLDTLVGIQRRLDERGEVRFPIVGYATRSELSSVGDY